MKTFWLNINSLTFIRLILLWMFVFINVSGCEEDVSRRTEEDPIVREIKRTVRVVNFPPEVQSNVDLAIEKWQNGILDPEPILINAMLTRPEIEEYAILFSVFDEDRNTLGMVLKEEYRRSGKKPETLEETYPVFAHLTTKEIPVVRMYAILVAIRTSNQQKDDGLWQEYVDADIDKLMREHVRKELQNEPNRIEAIDIIFSASEAVRPPMWISIPEPNEVEVSVWVYDKEGNKSNSVRLLNFIDYSEKDRQ